MCYLSSIITLHLSGRRRRRRLPMQRLMRGAVHSIIMMRLILVVVLVERVNKLQKNNLLHITRPLGDAPKRANKRREIYKQDE